MRSLIKKCIEKSLDIFFPGKCVICGEYGSLCCGKCLQSIESIQTNTCPECGKISINCQYCTNCRGKKKPKVFAVFVACSYGSSALKKIIYELKYSGITGLIPICGELMYQRVRSQNFPKNTVIVPVPLHKNRLNLRGFNQSELLARYLSKRMDLPGGDVLTRRLNTMNQVGLRREKRLSNLDGAFDCSDKEYILGKNIILVDDVVTTGATLNECAKVLKQSGAKRIFAVVLARNI